MPDDRSLPNSVSNFYWRWFVKMLDKPFVISESIAGGMSMVGGVVVWLWPPSNKFLSGRMVLIPLGVFGLLLIGQLFRVPYLLHREDSKIGVALRSERNNLQRRLGDVDSYERKHEMLCRCTESGKTILDSPAIDDTTDHDELRARTLDWLGCTHTDLEACDPDWGETFEGIGIDLGRLAVGQIRYLVKQRLDRLKEMKERLDARHSLLKST